MLLDEVVSSTVQRCIDPVLMEPKVIITIEFYMTNFELQTFILIPGDWSYMWKKLILYFVNCFKLENIMNIVNSYDEHMHDRWKKFSSNDQTLRLLKVPMEE